MEVRSQQEMWDELFGERAPDPLASRLLRTGEVARLFQVTERTVYEWARRGVLPSVRTPTGQYRYPAAAIRVLLLEGAHLPADHNIRRARRSTAKRGSADGTASSPTGDDPGRG